MNPDKILFLLLACATLGRRHRDHASMISGHETMMKATLAK
jgi:hypothetical protein